MGHRNDERGAVAIMVALLSLLLVSVAALAVDLGNLMVRKGDTQVQADLSALAAAAELPGTRSATDPAVLAVRDYLNGNQPQDDRKDCARSESCVTAAQLVDSDVGNGDVVFTLAGQRLEVITPLAHVSLGLAGALGFSEATVQSRATVQIGAPGALLPFFLPSGCRTGNVFLKANTPGNGNANLTYAPAAGSGSTIPKISAVAPNIFPGTTPSTIAITANRNPSHRFESTMAADFFFESSGERIPADVMQSVPVTVVQSSSSAEGRVTAELPPGVFNRPGMWQVRLRNSQGWSRDFGRFEIGDPTPPPTGCGVAATGDFGFVDSPRAGVTQAALASKMNIALGLDHTIVPFTGARPVPQQDSCNGNGAAPYPGAILDVDPQRDDANCINVQTGMQTDVVTDGLVVGGTGPDGENFDGLLETDTLEGCDRNGGSAEQSRLGHDTNDDVLSCFLTGTVTVADVTGATISEAARHYLSNRIFDSPRFAMVAVIDFQFNPANGHYPMIDFQPVFITDEPGSSRNGLSYASSANGIVLSAGDQKVVAVQAHPLNIEALPESAPNYSGPLTSWAGQGTRIVRLVN